ncbi:hypothetical protein PENSPDRAFT_645581 [Peniophora sp. CONT]|nr:hypothetical protein PENSPDRAFT_645581 [Peniophora sp. CONT]
MTMRFSSSRRALSAWISSILQRVCELLFSRSRLSVLPEVTYYPNDRWILPLQGQALISRRASSPLSVTLDFAALIDCLP